MNNHKVTLKITNMISIAQGIWKMENFSRELEL